MPTVTGYLITNARILDGTGREPFSGAVRVGGNRIAEVAAGPVVARPGETVIDGRGGTLMPGLIEPHAHLSFADVISYEMTRLPPEEHLLATVRNARTMLDSGPHFSRRTRRTSRAGLLIQRPAHGVSSGRVFMSRISR